MQEFDAGHADLAVDQDDHRFDGFQQISDAERITIGVGAPTRRRDGVCISLILFQPGAARQLYSKRHLHPDEEKFFVPGRSAPGLLGGQANVALAICYELSVPEHAAAAARNGAEIYIASVAKSVGGIDKALARLGQIAREYSMTVLMSNCLGFSDGCECAGRTSAWSNQGVLLGQLDDAQEGIIVLDAETHDVVRRTLATDGDGSTP